MWSRLLPNLDRQFWRKSIRLAFFALILVPALLLAETAPDVAARHRGNILFNGFEQGFYSTPVGAIGNGWGWFTNGGAANYGFYDDQWSAVVAEGSHSQLIEINTYGISGPSPDRFAGIYQTVPVVSGATYTLRMEAGVTSFKLVGPKGRRPIGLR